MVRWDNSLVAVSGGHNRYRWYPWCYTVNPFLKLNQLIAEKDLETARALQFCHQWYYRVLTSAHGNMYAVIKAVLRINEGLDLGICSLPFDASSRSGSKWFSVLYSAFIQDTKADSFDQRRSRWIHMLWWWYRRTSIKYGLADAKRQLLETHEMPTGGPKGGYHMLKTTKEISSPLFEEACLGRGGDFFWPGWWILIKGEIFYAGPGIPNYAGTQFKKEIEERLFRSLARLENDVNYCRSCRGYNRSYKGSNHAVYLTIGTEDKLVVSCLMVRFFTGFSNSACEVGYLHLPPDGVAFQGSGFNDGFGRGMWQNIMVILWNCGMVVGSLSGQQKEIKSVWQELIRMVAILERTWPISFYVMVNPEVMSFLEGGIMAQKPSWRALKLYPNAVCAELVPSLADKIRLEFAYHQKRRGYVGGLLPHFRQNMEHKTSRAGDLFFDSSKKHEKMKTWSFMLFK